MEMVSRYAYLFVVVKLMNFLSHWLTVPQKFQQLVIIQSNQNLYWRMNDQVKKVCGAKLYFILLIVN